MFPEQNNQESIKKFAAYLANIRQFFHDEGVTEVMTNPLMKKIIPDHGVDPIAVDLGVGRYFLHTSPEWEMKKALVNGSGSIYSLVHVFRDDLDQNWHKPAFLMLEWYMLGYTDEQLIEQCTRLFSALGLSLVPQIFTCRELYQRYAGIDMVSVTIPELKTVCKQHQLPYQSLSHSDLLSSWLELIWVNLIEPNLEGLVVVKDFPICQSALAKCEQQPYPRARRFEIFISGVEVANGYFEETNTQKLQERFTNAGSPHPVVDATELEGLPMVSGVSVGVERLLTIIQQ